MPRIEKTFSAEELAQFLCDIDELGADSFVLGSAQFEKTGRNDVTLSVETRE